MEPTPIFGDPVTCWRWWFAWRPVNSLSRGWVWLSFVKRRRIAKHSWLDGGADLWWQYA